MCVAWIILRCSEKSYVRLFLLCMAMCENTYFRLCDKSIFSIFLKLKLPNCGWFANDPPFKYLTSSLTFNHVQVKVEEVLILGDYF